MITFIQQVKLLYKLELQIICGQCELANMLQAQKAKALWHTAQQTQQPLAEMQDSFLVHLSQVLQLLQLLFNQVVVDQYLEPF